MKIMKSFSNIWKISKNMYFSVGQFNFRATFTYVGFVVALEVFMMTIGQWIPLPFGLDSPLTRFIVIPFGIAYFMDKKMFDGKKPYNFLKTGVAYCMKTKCSYLGRAVKFQKMHIKANITTVTSQKFRKDSEKE